jgi:hypothetical protein
MDGGEGEGGLWAASEVEETPSYSDWFSSASNGYPYQDRDKSIEMRTFLSGKLFFDLLLETVDLDGAFLCFDLRANDPLIRRVAALYPPKNSQGLKKLFDAVLAQEGVDQLRRHCLVWSFVDFLKMNSIN